VAKRRSRHRSRDQALHGPPTADEREDRGRCTLRRRATVRGLPDRVPPRLNFLQGLHGAVAIALLAGCSSPRRRGPTPVRARELTLLAAGLLIAAGGLDPVIFVPVALVACVAGSLVGYTWAGRSAIVASRPWPPHSPAARPQAGLGRVKSAEWGGIAVSRLIPGLRIYTTLVAGALRVRRRTFVLGMVPATVVWIAVYLALGVLVGSPSSTSSPLSRSWRSRASSSSSWGGLLLRHPEDPASSAPDWCECPDRCAS